MAVAAAVLIVGAHGCVVELDERQFSWHPIGHLSIFLVLLCLITIWFAAGLLVARRGRSAPALVALTVAVVEMVLLFTPR